MFHSHGPDFYRDRISREAWQAFDKRLLIGIIVASVALAAVVLGIVL